MAYQNQLPCIGRQEEEEEEEEVEEVEEAEAEEEDIRNPAVRKFPIHRRHLHFHMSGCHLCSKRCQGQRRPPRM